MPLIFTVSSDNEFYVNGTNGLALDWVLSSMHMSDISFNRLGSYSGILSFRRGTISTGNGQVGTFYLISLLMRW